MVPGAISGATRRLGKPEGLSDDECLPLHVRDQEVFGFPFMVSAWYPTPAEALAIAQGAPIHLHVMGHTMPVVAMTVGE